jgi:hypothetical protein
VEIRSAAHDHAPDDLGRGRGVGVSRIVPKPKCDLCGNEINFLDQIDRGPNGVGLAHVECAAQWEHDAWTRRADLYPDDPWEAR